jgi:peptidyl-prolyl cis-trans isomerase-like 2
VSQLKKIIFHRNEATDAIICPITLRTLNENSRVVVVKKTGNVFSYEAIKLMLDDAEKHKLREMRDPLTDDPFTKEDIITIQDPNKDIRDGGASSATGDAAKKGKAAEEEEKDPLTAPQEAERINATGTMARIMEQVKKKAQEREIS